MIPSVWRKPAPAGPRGLAGVAVLAVLVACEAAGVGGSSLEIDGESVSLPPGAEVYEVALRTAPGGGDAFDPEVVQVEPGDVVRFTSGPLGTHALAFQEDRLSPEAREFLSGSGQLRSPPLLDPDDAWVVSFAEAPPGEYPFLCLTHGARGTVRVRGDQS